MLMPKYGYCLIPSVNWGLKLETLFQKSQGKENRQALQESDALSSSTLKDIPDLHILKQEVEMTGTYSVVQRGALLQSVSFMFRTAGWKVFHPKSR